MAKTRAADARAALVRTKRERVVSRALNFSQQGNMFQQVLADQHQHALAQACACQKPLASQQTDAFRQAIAERQPKAVAQQVRAADRMIAMSQALAQQACTSLVQQARAAQQARAQQARIAKQARIQKTRAARQARVMQQLRAVLHPSPTAIPVQTRATIDGVATQKPMSDAHRLVQTLPDSVRAKQSCDGAVSVADVAAGAMEFV